MDVESFEEGYLAAIYTPEGGSADVGAVVAVMVEQQSEIGSVGSAPAPVATPAAPAPAATVTIAAAPAGASPEFEAITMPALSSTMKEGKIVSWSKKVGDKVSSGDMVLVVESDKADMDVESFEEGFLAAITVKDGEVADVGAPVGYLAPSAEAIPAVQAYVASMGATPAAPAAAAPAATAPAATAPAAAPAAAAPAVAGAHVPAMGTVNASPMARKLAAENNIALASVTGTGNFGRVVPDDVLKAAGKYVAPVSTTPPAVAAAASKAPGPAAVQVVYGVQPMSGMQKAVAKNMEKTLDVPVFRVSREIYTDDFDALYVQLKPKGVTVSAMLAKAVAEVLKKHPVVNAAYVDGGVKYSKDVNVAMAVAIDGGLMTPTIVKANEMDLFQIGRVWKELVGKAKEKKLTPAEYSTGTFTISNLGMFGVQQFDAILPPGTGSILAIAASTPKVVQDMSGQLKTVKCMTVTITCDHRHIYGADAAEFLKDLADLIENHSQSLTMG
ncbi:2-oxoacid dehydrogenases acyltransferase-domain-containing protein [Ochromonadaceae sp. CCMP2298]|nr:2-oxoacid dehydrogenases acyltransferase-domain-containing protein [Ochromonadaceae sp. CCMP2298]